MLQKKYSNLKLESGTDEAGRGCLAGPVTAAAVILPTHFNDLILNDSKQLSEKTREKLRVIIEKEALTFSVTHIEPEIIDKINILNASIKAMQESVLKLDPLPQYIILDGNAPLIHKSGLKNNVGIIYNKKQVDFLTSVGNTSIVKGDSKFMSIAAASVLAKTYRDEYMDKIHEEYPMYNWKNNKGYPTKEHRDAIRKYGITKYHRISFKLLPEQTTLDL